MRQKTLGGEEDGGAGYFYLLIYARNLLYRVLLYFLVIGHNRVLTDNIHKLF